MLILSAGLSAAVVTSVDDRRPHVLVRIDVSRTTAAFRMAAVWNEVREIWKPYADLDWVGRDVTLAGYDDALEVRVMDDSEVNDPMNGTLGWIMFAAPAQPRNVVNVSMAAIAALLNAGHLGSQPVNELPRGLRERLLTHAIGRVMAHEIGHYLLRSSAHAPNGLMRARLGVADFLTDGLGSFRLRPIEVKGLARRRSEAAMAGASSTSEHKTG